MQADKEPRRKLAAILTADAAGYSRLMGDDEAATVATLNDYRDIFARLITQHQGRVVDTAGDSVLAIFDSVVEAVQCAAEVQQVLFEKNAPLPEARRMAFRVGVNLGDVIEQADGSIYGDGVNIAARLQALAEPGGIYLSGTAYDQIKNKISLAVESLGEKTVKNIAEPIRVYRVSSAGIAAVSAQKKMRRGTLVLIASVLLAVAGVAIWQAKHPSSITAQPGSALPLKLPEGPSIAVLPFQNMSGKPEEDWFSDGMTETLITDLARLNNLFVIARNSTFTYKGKPVDVRQVGKELGVRYVLEGSVQRTNEWLRVNAQLIDAQTGRHMWAERYDRKVADVFNIQDDITQHIVTELEVKLLQGEMVRDWRKSTRSYKAYDLTLRGADAFYRWTEESMAQAQALFQQALDIDPKFTIAMTWLGWTHYQQADNGWSPDWRASYLKALALGRRAVANDPTEGEGHALLAWGLLAQQEFADAGVAADKARSLSPNNANVLANAGWALATTGRADEALQLVHRAMRLNPTVPEWYFGALGDSLLLSGKAADAEAAHRRCVEAIPENIGCRLGLAAAYIETGKSEQAIAQAREAMKINPEITAADNAWMRPIGVPEKRAHFVETFRRAGLK